MCKNKQQIEEISNSWDTGFLNQLREGAFSRELYNRLYSAIMQLDIQEHEQIDRELIRLLWFIPIFMYRMKEYFPDIPSKECDALREQLENAIERVFGYP